MAMTTAAETNTKENVALSDGIVIASLSLEALREHLLSVGYRVELIEDGSLRLLRSATNGLAFDVRPGNRFDVSGEYADFSFVTLFSVRGTSPMTLLNEWNRTHRFGRLVLDTPNAAQTFLVFTMDISVAGGVSEKALRTQIGLWDTLVQQLTPWLREQLGKLTPEIDAAAPEQGSAG